ncbi:MAG: hypothetical protein AUJ34_00215 [Parcubacteria group bacterium CG1_02_41_12]|nr:MAG: hypothetical protein AUJ34_00215 [Parcubacteria group bacterium CG1_02_41_12]PIQ78717.1 MAG: hypothetical protein COV79_05095 [Parcubacteria group bacterium CG11_big_fil_rev_8_21_14_0_20_41_14]
MPTPAAIKKYGSRKAISSFMLVGLGRRFFGAPDGDDEYGLLGWLAYCRIFLSFQERLCWKWGIGMYVVYLGLLYYFFSDFSI